jgi:predicted MPP superfamily phosphohydrolase
MAVAKLALLVAAGLHPKFGVAHVLYLDLVVVIPVGGLALLIAGPRDRVTRAVGVAALLLALVGVYGTFVEPRRLVLERTDVPLDPARTGGRPVSVAVLSDIQFRKVGAHEREAVARTMRERPDVILLPGDIHQGPRGSLERTLPELRELLSTLRAPGGVFFVLGDAEGLSKARRELAGTGVRLLHDEVARIRVRGRDITIGGIQRSWRSPAASAVISMLEETPGAGDVRILLAHRPDAGLVLRRGTRVDLTVAGHTHGGQIAPPGIGPLVVASGVPRDVGGGGLHDLGGGRRIYVSRGIGMERGHAPPVRIGAPPEISLLRLH